MKVDREGILQEVDPVDYINYLHKKIEKLITSHKIEIKELNNKIAYYENKLTFWEKVTLSFRKVKGENES